MTTTTTTTTTIATSNIRPKSARQEMAIAANKSRPTAGKKGQREADTPTGRQGEEEAKASSPRPPSLLQLGTSATAASATTFNEPPNSTEGNPTATATVVKPSPGVDTVARGVEEAKISFGDLGNGLGGDGGGGGRDVPVGSARVAESGAMQAGGGGGSGGRVRRRRGTDDTDGAHDADGDADVMEMLKHLPKLFLKDIMAHR